MQNFIKTIINSVRNWVKGEIKKSKADWNQNDSSADNYVKNRTHWEEDGVVHKLDSKYFDVSFNDIEDMPFGKETMVDEYIFKPQSVEFSRPYEDSNEVTASLDKYLEWGKTYFISIDDIEYEVTIDQSNGENDWGDFYIDDNILVRLYYYGYIVIRSLDYEGAHKISIYNKIPGVTSLDLKYLPEQLRFGLNETILFEGNVTLNQYCGYDFSPNLDLVVDQEYTCVIDGARYSEVCYWDDVDGNCFPLKDSDDNYVGWVYRYGVYLHDNSFEAFSSHNIKICIQDLRKIEDIYLPDDMARTPEVKMAQDTADYAKDTAEKNAINLITLQNGKSNLPTNLSVSSLVFVKNQFILTTGSNEVYCSEDGINWIQNTSLSPNYWRKVAYGDGKFVSLTNGLNTTRYAYYSEDGVEWIGVRLPENSVWCAVTYGNGKFVAIRASGNTAAYSEDGINWTLTQMPINASRQAVVYGDGKFVTLNAGASNHADYSVDGIHWVGITLPFATASTSLAYGNGMFVSGTSSRTNIDDVWYSNILYSKNGVDWIETQLLFNETYGEITYGNGRFINCNANGNVIYSEDGINWNAEYSGIIQNNKNVLNDVKDLIINATDSLRLSHFTLIDPITKYEYVIQMYNGNLTSICKISNIKVTTMPTQIEYINGEPFNPTGMIITATRQDGTEEVIQNVEDYEYDLVTTNNASAFEIRYTEYGTTYTTTIELIASGSGSYLSDFTYTIEEDGTYTLTGWNGTLNGDISTECIIPDSDKINL